MNEVLADYLRWSLALLVTGGVVASVGAIAGYVQLRWFPATDREEVNIGP